MPILLNTRVQQSLNCSTFVFGDEPLDEPLGIHELLPFGTNCTPTCVFGDTLRTHFLFSSFFFLYPIYYPRTASRPPSQLPVVAQIRGRIAGPPPPSPLRYVPSFLSREEFSIFFPRRLASNCTSYNSYTCRQNRVVPTHAARCSQSVDPFYFFFQVKSHHGGDRTQGPTLAAFEGNH